MTSWADIDNLAFLMSGWAVVFVIAYMKGAFGGGFGLLAVPVLALTTDPLTAVAIMSPLLVIMDALAIIAHPPRTWSRLHLSRLLPAAVIGLCCGVVILGTVSEALIQAIVASLAIAFAVKWFVERALGRRLLAASHVSNAVLGVALGGASGVASSVASAGGPLLTIYLLSQGKTLDKQSYAGTGVGFYAITNVVKLGLYAGFGLLTMRTGTTSVLLASAIPFGVWAGRKAHDVMSAQTIFFICHSLVLAAGVTLLINIV